MSLAWDVALAARAHPDAATAVVYALSIAIVAADIVSKRERE